jgi:ATP-binding protein involved in chromosome partitioning
MMGLAGKRPTTTDGKTFDPPRGHGIPVMSIGFLIDSDQPMAWRGPMVTQALTQMLADTRWGTLDYLVVDMPPGTGDIQLTLTQRVPVSGAIIVTTPQEIALLDARKGLQMFRKVGVPVLGIVENMGLHRCPACGHESHIFDSGGGAELARRYETTLLGQLPLEARIREQVDGGTPTVVADPASQAAATFHSIARRAAGQLAASALRGAVAMPAISIEDE